MPATLVFRLADVDVTRVRSLSREEKREIVLQGIKQRELYWEGLSFATTPANNDAICLMSRISGFDVLNDEELSQTEMAGRQQVKTIVNFLRRKVPGFEKCYIAGIAPRVGVRESRRIVGVYTLTDEDMFDNRLFEDVVALCGGPLDIHDHKGSGILLKMLDHPFQIPMRCLLPVSIDGLVVTGRTISATRQVSSTIRNMPTVMALGQAAGTIAALAASKAVSPRALSPEEVRNILKEYGAVLSQQDIH